jgi:branched-chain amino acid transport system permease protein
MSATAYAGERWGSPFLWSVFAALTLLMPWIFESSLSITLLSQIGIAIVACLSYNILLGQGGMLSFGHAVYTGLGSFAAIHALNAWCTGTGGLPVSLVPLLGGLAGMGFAILFGYVTTRNSGAIFAMITLGVGELVFAIALVVPEFFGGEGGVSGNRVVGQAVLGISFGPAVQVYYLIAVYTFVCVGLMYAFTQTPLGRLLNATRDNPERVGFIGYDPQRVRYCAFIIAGFFAGISGGLGALNFEIVNAEVLGPTRSAAYLLFTFLGGTTFFFGPIVGAVLMVLAFALLSVWTKAWLFYLGAAFIWMVTVAPAGIAGLIMENVRLAQYGQLFKLLPSYGLLVLTGGGCVLAFSALVEMTYFQQLESGSGPIMYFLGLPLDTSAPACWLKVLALLALMVLAFVTVRRRFAKLWSTAQQAIEDKRLQAPRVE